MSKRISLVILALLAFAMCWSGVQRSAAQDENERKQTLVIGYPNPSIIVSGSGPTAVRYGGIIYVKVFPISPALIRKNGAGPVATAELSPSQRDVCILPLGEYEVRFSMRKGSELSTFIVRDVILRADRASALIVEMNSEAKTTIIGGEVTAQQMADSIRQLQKEISDLKDEVARLKQK